MNDRKCHWVGCDSGARWGVKLQIECQGTDERRVLGFKSSIECCDEHRVNVKPWVLSDENREVITTNLMERGYPEPNFITAQIEFLPIEREPLLASVPCDRHECTKPAKWRVIQVIPHISRPRDPVRLTTSLCVCDEHKVDTGPEALLDPESRAITHKALKRRGLTLRSLDRMKLDFEPV